MSLRAVLFDLDGTLLPMDQEYFTQSYFKLLTKKAAPYGYEAEKLIDTIWRGIAVMVQNNGKESNEAVFWKEFARVYGEDALADRWLFQEFYSVEFEQAKEFCGYNADAVKVVKAIKEMGYRVVLSTNPLFPDVATRARIRWAGLAPEDFELYTTYENTGYCKPNPAYFTDIASRIGLIPRECLVVGNDVSEDMVAREVGMDVFLLTDHLINRQQADIDAYPHGGFAGLMEHIKQNA